MDVLEKLKLFGMSNSMLECELDKIEKEYELNFHRKDRLKIEQIEQEFYPQFTSSLRSEAADMARQYELFYCLERNIRDLISQTLEAQHGSNWWNQCIPDETKKNVKDNKKREMDSGMTRRSDEEIDYTTFGELGGIVSKNWSDFEPLFSSQKAFQKIMTSLNLLRGPIAHCCPLAEDEVVRLRLTIRDWFRLMG